MSRIGSHEIDDVVQEVFLRAFKGLKRLKEPSKFTSYLGQIARNYCVDCLRMSGKHTAVSLDEIELEPPPRQNDDNDKDLLLERLRREVSRLPETQREVLLLFYFEKMSYAQMAEALGLTEAAVNQRLSRARQQLRESFAARAEAQQ